ncbi:hypothetical protein [Streptomyces sp. V4I2]|uniref:hypothetical protein n=1 Tax=Streptomyces sp. V4I2 TaxID=3042280 RepID=UPI002787D313|nr:hypothetical protein [Streptomyces sp. V4I2]MDQ1051742.1 hypothetical protein [Streptomyces sp. V4I2]
METVRNACPEIASACALARDFTDMLRHRRGHLLRDWIQKAELGGPDAIGIFADSIRQGLQAVTACLTLSYSSGIVEGHVNSSVRRHLGMSRRWPAAWSAADTDPAASTTASGSRRRRDAKRLLPIQAAGRGRLLS